MHGFLFRTRRFGCDDLIYYYYKFMTNELNKTHI